MWNDDADTLMLKLWNAGHSLGVTAAELAKAGYKVSRGAVAGRKDRLIKWGAEVTRKGKVMQPTVKTEKKKISNAEAGAARAARRLARKPSQTTPEMAQATVEAIETASIEADIGMVGVQYFENEGCKAILDIRGDWDLPLCCGQPRGIDSLGRDSSYCPTHHARFNTNAAGSRRTY
jgi:hypothetical protein